MNRHRTYRPMNPLTGIWPAYGNAISYRYLSPDGDGFPVTYSVTHSHTDHSSLITVHSSHTFSAKERDVETGLSYFGSRYYSSDLSIWLSVDPMASKYPSLSPYNYCYNNPIIIKDPNGQYGVIAITEQCDDNGNVTGGTATLVMNYYYNSKNNNSVTKSQADFIENNIKTNLDLLKGQQITINGVQYTFDYNINFIDLATVEYGTGNPERWSATDNYSSTGFQVGNFLENKTLSGDDVGLGSQYSIVLDFDKLSSYIESGKSDGQTPTHELFHNIGAKDSGKKGGTRIMDYNHQENGEQVSPRHVQIEDIENLINQNNNKLRIVYEKD